MKLTSEKATTHTISFVY